MGKQGKRRSVFIQNGTGYYVSADGKFFVDKSGNKVSKPVKAEDDNTTPKAKKPSHKIGKLVSNVVSTLRCGKAWRVSAGVRKLISLKNGRRVRFGQNTEDIFERYDHKTTYTDAEPSVSK